MDELISAKINITFQKLVLKCICMDADLEPCQTSKMEFFAEMVKGWKLLFNYFNKKSILDIWEHSEKASASIS